MKNIILVVITILLAIQLFSAEKATEFKLENIEGKQVKLSDFQKEGLVILDFWATWCVPCKKSLPKMNELHKKYENVNVVTICTDKPRKKSDAISHVKSNKFKFHTLFDLKKVVQKQFNVTSIPYSLIIDQDGTILYEHTGYQRGDEKHYEEIIVKWLEKQVQQNEPNPETNISGEMDNKETKPKLESNITGELDIKDKKPIELEQKESEQSGH